MDGCSCSVVIRMGPAAVGAVINTQAAKKWAMNSTHSAMDGSGKTVTLSAVP